MREWRIDQFGHPDHRDFKLAGKPGIETIKNLEADDNAVASNGIHEDGWPKRLDGIGNFMCWQ